MMEQTDLEIIKKKAENFESQYIKLKQEFKDYIEVTRRNEDKKRQEMKIDFAKKLLVVADSLERVSELNDASSMESHCENTKQNIAIIYKQLISASGLTPIAPRATDKFDERLHKAVGLEYTSTYSENSVCRVIRKGYQIENSVVRPCEVIVSKHPEEARVVKPGLINRLFGWINNYRNKIGK